MTTLPSARIDELLALPQSLRDEIIGLIVTNSVGGTDDFPAVNLACIIGDLDEMVERPSPSPAKGEAEPVAGEPRAIVWHDACATEDCMRPATERIEYGGFGSVYCKDCYAKIMALVPAASPLPVEDRQVRVKPLEWRQTSTYSYADTPFGEYTVQHYTESEGQGWSAVFCDNAEIGNFPTDLIACSACQADYESRILSALSPSTLGGER